LAHAAGGGSQAWSGARADSSHDLCLYGGLRVARMLAGTTEMVDMAHTPTAHPTRGHVSPFWRHFLQMLAVMMAGMIIGAALLLTAVGLKTWEEVTTQYGTQALLVMAVGMTAPMVVWMLHRGMGRRNTYEMAAVMVLPVIPFLCLVWFGVTTSAQCGAYCGVTILAMLGLMFYRRDEYSMPM
jgi:cytochrome bd-type quinol oxidase subunit 2